MPLKEFLTWCGVEGLVGHHGRVECGEQDWGALPNEAYQLQFRVSDYHDEQVLDEKMEEEREQREPLEEYI
jgi:hypothetical protein